MDLVSVLFIHKSNTYCPEVEAHSIKMVVLTILPIFSDSPGSRKYVSKTGDYHPDILDMDTFNKCGSNMETLNK